MHITQQHVDHADSIAGAYIRRYGLCGEAASEARSSARLALVESAARYDPTRSASLQSFAGHRIWYAMVDRARASYTPEVNVDLDSACSTPATDDLLMRKQRAALVRDAIARVPGELGTLSRLRWVDGLTLRQCGAAIGRSKAWCCRAEKRAIAILADLL